MRPRTTDGADAVAATMETAPALSTIVFADEISPNWSRAAVVFVVFGASVDDDDDVTGVSVVVVDETVVVVVEVEGGSVDVVPDVVEVKEVVEEEVVVVVVDEVEEVVDEVVEVDVLDVVLVGGIVFVFVLSLLIVCAIDCENEVSLTVFEFSFDSLSL